MSPFYKTPIMRQTSLSLGDHPDLSGLTPVQYYLLTAPKSVSQTSLVKHDRPAVTGRANLKAANMVFDGKQRKTSCV
jgi:hypothetical protein